MRLHLVLDPPPVQERPGHTAESMHGDERTRVLLPSGEVESWNYSVRRREGSRVFYKCLQIFKGRGKDDSAWQ